MYSSEEKQQILSFFSCVYNLHKYKDKHVEAVLNVIKDGYMMIPSPSILL